MWRTPVITVVPVGEDGVGPDNNFCIPCAVGGCKVTCCNPAEPTSGE